MPEPSLAGAALPAQPGKTRLSHRPCAARGLRLLPPHSRVFPVAQAGAGDRFPSAAALAEEPRQRSRSEPEQLKAPAADGRCRLSPRHRLLALPLLNLSPDSSDSPLLLTYPPPRTSQPSRTPTFSCAPSPYFQPVRGAKPELQLLSSGIEVRTQRTREGKLRHEGGWDLLVPPGLPLPAAEMLPRVSRPRLRL